MLAAALVVTGAVGEAQGGVILSNLPPTYTAPTYNTNGQVNTGLGLNYAVEFQATSPMTVTSVEVVLSIQAGTTPTVAIYNSTNGGALGTIAGSFTDSSLVTGTAKTETFTGSAALTGGNKYFLVVDGNNYFNWSATFTAANPKGLTPTGAGATYLAAGSSGSYASGNTKPSFELDGSISDAGLATPEPSTLLMAGCGGLALLASRLRRAKAASSV